MLFRVSGGSYRDKDGKVYRKGDVVESEQELDKEFKNIFERIDGKPFVEQIELKQVKTDINLDELESQEKVQKELRRSLVLEEEKPKEPDPKTDHIVPELVEVEDGKWNIVNSVTGKNINDFPLSKIEAEQVKTLFEGKDIVIIEPKRKPAPMRRRLPRRKSNLKRRPKRSIKIVDI